MKRVTVVSDEQAAAWAAAEIIAAEIEGGARTVVLAGGSTPRRCYEALAGRPLPWGAGHDPRWGRTMRVTARSGEQLPDGQGLPSERDRARLDPPDSCRAGPEAGATAYEAVLERCRPIDVVLLGMGPDGHCASLFPEHPALHSQQWVVPVRGAPKPPPDRVSLSLRSLRAARRVLFLVTGTAKAAAVARARLGEVPAGLIPQAEWLLDEGAASLLGSV